MHLQLNSIALYLTHENLPGSDPMIILCNVLNLKFIFSYCMISNHRVEITEIIKMKYEHFWFVKLTKLQYIGIKAQIRYEMWLIIYI